MNTTKHKVPTDEQLIELLRTARRVGFRGNRTPEEAELLKTYADYILTPEGGARVDALRAQAQLPD